MEAFRSKSPSLLLAEDVSGVSDRKSGRLASSGTSHQVQKSQPVQGQAMKNTMAE